MKRQLSLFVLAISFAATPLRASDSILSEGFDSQESGEPIVVSSGWTGFAGFRGEGKPIAAVKANVGVDGSQALAISHTEPFRTDNFGLKRKLPQPISDGVVWVQCSFKPPKKWHGGLFFDMRGEKANQVNARIAGGPFKAKGTEVEQLRWHSIFNVPHWRLYTKTAVDQDWHTLTARIDYEQETYACWVDDQTLGDEMPLASRAPFAQFHISVAGAPGDPALIDNPSSAARLPTALTTQSCFPNRKMI